jgi:NADPH:quinone reductase-like Zn-dependent oxidoreductase
VDTFTHADIMLAQASTVSYTDCLIRRGMSFEVLPATSLPATPGMDVVGTIIQVGENVKNVNVGDRVATLVRTGGNARYISVSASDLVAVPRACNSAEAACMVSTYMTAYQSIRLATNN